jgi:hypothetical protein
MKSYTTFTIVNLIEAKIVEYEKTHKVIDKFTGLFLTIDGEQSLTIMAQGKAAEQVRRIAQVLSEEAIK